MIEVLTTITAKELVSLNYQNTLCYANAMVLYDSIESLFLSQIG
ncbi:MAG: hypothetical protein ACK5RO_06440 [Pseudobdellovibrionaceae bacterium]